MANRVVNFSNRVQGLLVLVVILLHSIYSVYCVTTTLATSTEPPVMATPRTTTPTTTTGLPAIPTISSSSVPMPAILTDEIIFRDSVMPSMDSEKEARELYDKALKQYGSYGASARNICATWELRGCTCSGAVEELALSCRGIGFEEVPLDLPLEIIKL